MSDLEQVWVKPDEYRVLGPGDYAHPGITVPGLLCLRCGIRIYIADHDIHDRWHGARD